MLSRVIHIWGDSIGKGVVYDEQRNKYTLSPIRCADQVQTALGIPVYNHARMGATVQEGLDMLQKKGIFEDHSADRVFAIEYGGNDCDLNWPAIAADPQGNHDAKVPLALFREKLGEFVQRVRISGGRVILVTPPPLEATRYFNWVTRGLNAAAVLAYLGDVQHIYRWQERYALAVRDVAHTLQCELLDVRDFFLAERNFQDLLCIDGIHPNANGQALITRAALQTFSS